MEELMNQLLYTLKLKKELLYLVYSFLNSLEIELIGKEKNNV